MASQPLGTALSPYAALASPAASEADTPLVQQYHLPPVQL